MVRSFVVGLAFAVPLLAQPMITSITPNIGPHDGGTEVVIRGQGLAAGPIEDPPQTTEIYFGGKLATILSLGTEEVHVLTPKNVAGPTDVTVEHGTRTVVRNAFAYDDPSWERLLVPIAYHDDVPGVNGSIWHVSVNGYNPGSADRMDAQPFGCSVSCGDQAHGGALYFIPVGTSSHTGQFLYFHKTSDKPVYLTENVRDLSRDAKSFGTEVMVPRKEDLPGPDTVLGLGGIHTDPRYRYKLRLYQFDGADGGTATVRISDQFGTLVSTFTMTLTSETYQPNPLYPGYAELDLDPAALATPATLSDNPASITITPPAEGLYWAVLSITNNDTQEVTTMTVH